MKTTLQRIFMGGVAALLVVASTPSALQADDILWTATATQSSAWITPGNWAGATLPLSGDVAQFGEAGGASISYSMTHGSNPTPNAGNIGAISLLDSRTVRDLSILSHSGGQSTFYYHGATVNGVDRTVLANQSAKHLTITSSGGGAARVSLTEGVDSVIQLQGAGNISVMLPILGQGARLVVQGSGTGEVTLAGSSTYSGGTLVKSGTLRLGHANAAGSGAIVNEGGAVVADAGVQVANTIALTSESARYQRMMVNGDAYAPFAVQNSVGAGALKAVLLGGTAGGARTLEGAFESLPTPGGSGPAFRLSGTGDDLYVLQLSLDTPIQADSFLGRSKEGAWVNATEGNTATGSLARLGVAGSFSDSGVLITEDYLGSWGYDVTNGAVWAVLDYEGGSFAVVPEPSVAAYFGLLGLAGAGGLWRWRHGRSSSNGL